MMDSGVQSVMTGEGRSIRWVFLERISATSGRHYGECMNSAQFD